MQKKKPARDALIGEEVEVIASANKTLIGIRGKVIDETKEMIEVSTQKGNRKIVKAQVAIKINEKNIEGKNIQGRIETRIKQQ